MTLVLKIVALIFLTISKGVYPTPLSLAFHIFALIDIAIIIGGDTFPMRFSSHHLALVMAMVFGGVGANSHFLRIGMHHGHHHGHQQYI